MNIDLGSLNYLAIIVGIIINQALGAAWYSALGKPWMAGVGLTMEDLEAMKGTARQWYPYVVAAVSALVFTLGLALVIQGMGAEGVVDGLILGLLAAIGFIGDVVRNDLQLRGPQPQDFPHQHWISGDIVCHHRRAAGRLAVDSTGRVTNSLNPTFVTTIRP